MLFNSQFVKHWRLVILLQLAGFILAACTTPAALTTVSAHNEATHSLAFVESVLNTVVAETSGLVCLNDGSFLTINDSGHSATVYRLSSAGDILDQFSIDAANQDWEAMTVHQGKLWLGDIGNNSGARQGGDLYQVAIKLDSQHINHAQKTSYVYPDLPLLPLQTYQHDFDAEALVSANQQLLLFNKAWQSEHSSVYRLITKDAVTSAHKIADIHGLPGVITDAAFSQEQQLFVITGYARPRQNLLNMALYDNYQPFLAVLDLDFKLQAIVPVSQGGQLEGICIDQQHQIWLSQEQSKRHAALLWRWGSIQQLNQQKITESLQIK